MSDESCKHGKRLRSLERCEACLYYELYMEVEEELKQAYAKIGKLQMELERKKDEISKKDRRAGSGVS
jgi:hypothetical protein